MTKSRKYIVIIGLMLLLVITLVGVSWAVFNYSGLGTKLNTITTGSITMSYEETDNTISLNGALPTTDKTGKVKLNEGEYFDFTVSSNIVGNVNINYEISAKEVGDGTIDGSNIKLYLTRIKDDGKEEALMVPEVYNEESTSNNYTGRPANEMSLYTSSMSSSENNKYRLRMYVDEGYNTQGDGGGLTFSIQINVYGKDGDKYVPPTTKDILEDNELQEEKENMFSYASNGNYIDINSMNLQNDPNYVTKGLYSMEDEDGVSYYFRGNVDNNNVQFGEYESDYYLYKEGNKYFQSLDNCQENNKDGCTTVKLASKGDKMYWKIVRINGDGSLRLIYNGTSTNPDNSDITNSFMIGKTVYNLNGNDPKYTGYTYDNGIDSFVKKEVDTWYNNTLGSNSTFDSKVIGGRFCSDSSGYKKDIDYGFPDISYNVFASYDRLSQRETKYNKPNMPTLKCPETSESYGGSYILKAGLITADELILAGENPGVNGADDYLSVGNSSMYYWSMTPSNFRIESFNATVWFISTNLGNGYVTNNGNFGIRPVINVRDDNGFTSGDGTATNPYVIS